MALLFGNERVTKAAVLLPQDKGGADGHYPTSGQRGRGGEENSERSRVEVEGEEGGAGALHLRNCKREGPEESPPLQGKKWGRCGLLSFVAVVFVFALSGTAKTRIRVPLRIGLASL